MPLLIYSISPTFRTEPLRQVINKCHSHRQNIWRNSLYLKVPILRRPEAAIFADIIKILTMFIIAIYKDSRKVKINKNYASKCSLYLISWYSKICWFPVKKCWCQQNSGCVSRDSFFFFNLLWIRYNCAKFHHCKICLTDFRKGGLFDPPPIREKPRKSSFWIGLKYS